MHDCCLCGCACYCHGDIDDCPVEDPEYAYMNCGGCGCEDDWDDGFDDWGCCFPGQCLMPGEHMRSECHTVEMVRDQQRQQNGHYG